MHTALLSTPPAAARPAPRAIQIAAASALRRPALRPALARRTPPASVGASPSLRPARPARRVGGAQKARARPSFASSVFFPPLPCIFPRLAKADVFASRLCSVCVSCLSF